jgi:molybdopterin biosynthesis enzyme MoaB
MDAIFTVGGVGYLPTDMTPEATREVLTRPAPGLEQALRGTGGGAAALGRGTAGLRGRTVIMNLPGDRRELRSQLARIQKSFPLVVAAAAGRRREEVR